jgi:hypothetical protein
MAEALTGASGNMCITLSDVRRRGLTTRALSMAALLADECPYEPVKGSALDIPGRALDWFAQYLFGALRAPSPLCGPTTSTQFTFGAA